MKLHGLSGFVVTKNCLQLDYCIRECIASMLPLCNEVVVGDMGSTDGTWELLSKWVLTEPKIAPVKIKDWTQERGNMLWYVNALNETKEAIQTDMAIQLDADEVLGDDPRTIAIIKKCVAKKDAIAIDRLNFAKNPQSLIPEGSCCGKFCVRVGPSDLWWPSDEPHNRGEVPLLDMAHIEPEAKIFHLGFLRRREAFFAKAKVVLGAFFNEYDKRLAQAEEEQREPLSKFPWWNEMVPYDGYHPESVKRWLRERGYTL